MKRPGAEADLRYRPDYEVFFFDSEYDLIREVLKVIVQYPVVITFNGDNFDLPYLYNRALALGIPKEELPIAAKRDYVSVVPGIHIDLFKFFAIKAVEAYAFGGVYRGERGSTASPTPSWAWGRWRDRRTYLRWATGSSPSTTTETP